MTTRVLVPSGVLGIGFDRDALAAGTERGPDIICIDGGSTDSGPHYLGTGTSKYSRAGTKAEWRALMAARTAADVPLVLGSCGTCGTDAAVDWMFEITREVAAEMGQHLKVARLYSSQAPQAVRVALTKGALHPLAPEQPISDALLASCTNVVALAGAEQVTAALDTGADVVLVGRATDTATISALPIQRGEHAGAAWHGAKIAECGALCSTNPTSGVVLVDVDATGFTVEPLAAGAACTPHSVSAHMLYENADPFVLYEPGGHLDVSAARYAALDARRVRVTGATWTPAARYTVKLEGARVAGYQSTIMAILRDARYVANAKEWIAKLSDFLTAEIASSMGLGPDDYTLEFRLIGVDATLGELETGRVVPTEVGVLGIVTATSQALASELTKLMNPFVLHYPLTKDEELPTFAFPFSPADTERGALHEFCLNHVLEIDDPMSVFRLRVDAVGHA